jgi:hypothetical protein
MFLHGHCDLEGRGNLFLYEIASRPAKAGLLAMTGFIPYHCQPKVK